MKARMNTERMISKIARGMKLGYLNETYPRANLRLDKFRRVEGVVTDMGTERSPLPCLLNVQSIEGNIISDNGFMKDEPSLLLCFCDAMPLDFTGGQARAVAERLWHTAVRFVGKMRASGFWEDIPETLPYRVTFDRFDACLCVLSVEMRVREAVGECEEG